MSVSNVRIFPGETSAGSRAEAEALWFVAELLLEQWGRSPEQVVAEIGERPDVAERPLNCVAGST